jgi:putative radical SAM enzyme (TIGR03279 family)
MLRIAGVEPGSPASRNGLKAGDFVVFCEGLQIDDWIDFARAASGGVIDLAYRRGTVQRRVQIRRRGGTGWGISLEGSSPRACRNSCIFCFMDQMPDGLRPTLRHKDDDVRHSFVYGTYVTLGEQQVRFAIDRRLSPIHVSVHVTDPKLRGALLGLPGPSPILPLLEMLGGEGLEVEAQIVVVPGWNDGNVLSSTLGDLYSCTSVISVGVVPVGLTRFREGLASLRRPSPEEAAECISICRGFSDDASKDRGTPWVWPADEMFLIAGMPLPPSSWYAECSLLANGIGLLSSLMDLRGREFSGSGTVLTGVLAAPFVSEVLSGSGYETLPVRNEFFGEVVGVAGLLTGGDVLRTVREFMPEGPLYLPSVMFSVSGATLDDWTLAGLASASACDMRVADSIGELP